MIVLLVSLAILGGAGTVAGLYFAGKEHKTKTGGAQQMQLRMEEPEKPTRRAVAMR